MPNRLAEFSACYEALRGKPLPAYEDDTFFDAAETQHRIGRIISESMVPAFKASD